MKTPALLFPQTALRRSSLTAFCPLCEPLLVLRPGGLDPPRHYADLVAASMVEYLSPPAEVDPAQRKRIAELIDQWGRWSEMVRGSGVLEAMKAGLELPGEDPENLDAIRKEIREYGRRVQQQETLTPEVRADLLLHLAHLQDREAAEMQELLASAERSGKMLSRLMGQEEGDTEPAEFSSPADMNLPPLSHSLDAEHPVALRLQAWANLAGRIELPAAWLATSNAPAAQWLLERANRRLLGEDQRRSPAGASQIAWPPPSAGPQSPLAQEAARLQLPDLGYLDDRELMELRQKLHRQELLAQLRQGLANLLELLAAEPWSPQVAAEAAGRAESLSAAWSRHLAELAPAAGPPRSLSLVVFPGLDRGQVLGLMAGDEPAGLPPAADWPEAWPAGSCPMLVAW